MINNIMMLIRIQKNYALQLIKYWAYGLEK